MTHIFIVGSKGIPAQYGGFETFVEKHSGRAGPQGRCRRKNRPGVPEGKHCASTGEQAGVGK